MIRRLTAFCKLLAGLMTKTSDNMIVDETGRLHVRVDDCTANKFEAALLEIFTQCV